MAEQQGVWAWIKRHWWKLILAFLLIVFTMTTWVWPAMLEARRALHIPLPFSKDKVVCSLPLRIPIDKPAPVTCIYTPSAVSPSAAPFQVAFSIPEDQSDLYFVADGSIPRRSLTFRFSPGRPQRREGQILQAGTARGWSFFPQIVSIQYPAGTVITDPNALPSSIKLGLETGNMVVLHQLVITTVTPNAPIILLVTAAFALLKYAVQYQEQERARREKKEASDREKAMASLSSMKRSLADISGNKGTQPINDVDWKELEGLRQHLNASDWWNLQRLKEIAVHQAPYSVEQVIDISSTGGDWPDAAAGALMKRYHKKQAGSEFEKSLLRDALTTISGCSIAVQDAIAQTLKEFGALNPPRETRWPPKAEFAEWKYIYDPDEKFNPFPAQRAEDDHRLFFVEKQKIKNRTGDEQKKDWERQTLFWEGHSIYEELRKEEERGLWIISGEAGTGKSVMAMALGQYDYGDPHAFCLRLRGIFEEKSLYQRLFDVLGRFLVDNPSHGMRLHARLLEQVSICLNFYAPNTTVRLDDRLHTTVEEYGKAVEKHDEKEPAILQEELAQISRLRQALSAADKQTNHGDPLEILGLALKKLHFNKIRLVIDAATTPAEAEVRLLEQIVDASEALPIPVQAMVFLHPNRLFGWRNKVGWKQRELRWTQAQLTSMMQHRIQAAWSDIEEPEEQIVINPECHKIIESSSTPRQFIEGWESLYSSMIEHHA